MDYVKRYRDAKTGHYVTANYAKAHPDTTVCERDKLLRKEQPKDKRH